MCVRLILFIILIFFSENLYSQVSVSLDVGTHRSVTNSRHFTNVQDLSVSSDSYMRFNSSLSVAKSYADNKYRLGLSFGLENHGAGFVTQYLIRDTNMNTHIYLGMGLRSLSKKIYVWKGALDFDYVFQLTKKSSLSFKVSPGIGYFSGNFNSKDTSFINEFYRTNFGDSLIYVYLSNIEVSNRFMFFITGGLSYERKLGDFLSFFVSASYQWSPQSMVAYDFLIDFDDDSKDTRARMDIGMNSTRLGLGFRYSF